MSYAGSSRKLIVWGLAGVIAAMLADLAETLIDPAGSGEAADIVAAATQHHGRMVLSSMLLLASAAFLLPGIFALTRLLTGRGRRFGIAATVLALLGTLGHAALGGIYFVWGAMPAASGSHAELIAGIERANDSAWLAPLAVLFIAFPVSLVVFFGSMVRGRLAPRWVLIPALAAPASAIAQIGGEAASTATALVLLLIAAAALAVSLLGRPSPEHEPRSTPIPVGP